MATRVDDIQAYAVEYATPVQLATLAKMVKLGWRVTRVLGQPGKADVAMATKGQGAWLRADGTLVRPKAGCKTAQIAR